MIPPDKREGWIIRQARERPAAERPVFLDGACAGDVALRERLEALLAAHDHTSQATETDAARSTIKLDLADAADEAVGQTLGRYKLLERVGEGGCGVVYVAEQTEPVRRRVALKVIKLGMDTKQVVARFEAERQALAMMDHPNIAKVLDAGTTGDPEGSAGFQPAVSPTSSRPGAASSSASVAFNASQAGSTAIQQTGSLRYDSRIAAGRPYFVMELVRGIKITDYCDQANLSTKERIDLFIKVCQAIQHAHQKGIIHRDIKPSNILVTLHDGVPVPKVIDFGIAKATEGRLTDNTVYTQLHQFIGTPAYMSPEQAEMSGLDIDTRSDIYSLGVLLYELLAGSTPFDAKELMASGIDAMRKTIREKEPPRPSTRFATLVGEELTTTAKRRSTDTSKLMHQLRGDLDWIVMKCLEKDRTRRYDTANGLAMDLKRHLNNEPVAARPPSATYKFQKAYRRNKLAFSAAAAVLAALLVGLGAATWAFVQENRAHQRALLAEQEQSHLRAEAEAAQNAASQQRDLARERLYESFVREARSIRKARQIGYRHEVFDRLKQAIALGTTNADTSVLRREAAACLGDWVGLDPVDITIPGGGGVGALTADGALAAIATSGVKISLRETRTGREVALLEAGGNIYSLAFDQRALALFVAISEGGIEIGKQLKSVRLEKWSFRGDGLWKKEWTRAQTGVTSVSSTATGPVALVLGASDSNVIVMDLDREVELVRVPGRNRMPWLPMAEISADRRQLAFFSFESPSGFDMQVEVWDLVSGQPLANLKPHLGSGWGLSFGNDGSLAATYDNTLIVYDTAQFSPTLSLAGSFDNAFGGTIGGAARLLALPAGQELAVRLVQLQSGREVAYLKLPGIPFNQRFSQDGSVLLLTHSRGSRVIHLKVESEKLGLEGHRGGVPAVEFSPNGMELASVGKDRTLRLWDLQSSGESRLLGQLPAPGQTLAYSPKGDYVVCGYYNTGELSIWLSETGKKVVNLDENADHRGTTWACAISPDGKHLAAIGSGLRVWDMAEIARPASSAGWTDTPLLSESNCWGSVVFDPAGKHLAYKGGSNSDQILMRDLVSSTHPTLVATNLVFFPVQVLSFLPRSGALAYVAPNREIAILEPATGRVLRTFSTLATGETSGSFVVNLRASPDESMLAMASISGLGVDLRDTATGKLLYTLPEEPGTVWFLAWSPDSRRLAVSRANGEITIWNLKEVEAQLSQLGLKP